MSKSFATIRLEEIKAIAQQEIPVLIAQNCDKKKYNAKRAVLNAKVIEFCVGGTLSGKNSDKFKFNHHLPSKAKVAEAAEVINTFIRDVENPYLKSLENKAYSDDDDMDIPGNEMLPAGIIIDIKKASNKNLRKAILGKDGLPYYRSQLTGTDVYNLAAAGDEARKKHKRTVTLIVAGTAVALTAAGVAGYCYYKKKQSDKDKEMLDDINAEIADEEIADPDAGSDIVDPDADSEF